MKLLFQLLVISHLGTLHTQAEEIDTSLVQQINATHYRIGTISFDTEKRSISFPAKIQMVEGNIEYLLVTERGKTHESLFHTDISPTHLNVALKLLSFEESKELFSKKDVKTPLKDAASLEIIVTWEKDGKTSTFPVTDLIQHNTLKKSMPVARWMNTGSKVTDGKFSATITGDIVAIYNDESSMINFSGDGRNDDTIWEPFQSRLPAVESPVTLTIKPFLTK